MNKTPEETTALINEIKPLTDKAGCDVLVCVPFVDLQAAVNAASSSNIKVGAQNCHWAESGAFTGEISAKMLTALGVGTVMIGHSERRQYFGETDQSVNLRVTAALAAGLQVILCVGETKEQRESGITPELVRLQTKLALTGVTAEQLNSLSIAYEPVWAIGTGLTATGEQANEVCALIRNCIAELYTQESAEKLTVQYGGSMNAKNAAELLAMPDIDGGLIGGASLVPADFAEIIRAANA